MNNQVLHVSTVHKAHDTRIFVKECRALAKSDFLVQLATTVGQHSCEDGVELLPLGPYSTSRLARIFRNLRAARYIFGCHSIIHIHDPELLLIGGCAAFTGRAVVFDVHEFYYEKIGESGWIPPLMRSFVKRLYQIVEAWVAPKLAGVVIVSPSMRPHYEKLVRPSRIALVQNYPYVSPHERDVARHALRPHDSPYIIHTGGVSKLRGFDLMVDVAERLRALGVKTPIVNLGEVDLSDFSSREQADLRARAATADVHIQGTVTYQEALRWLAHAELGYIPLELTLNNSRGMPNKLFEYLLFGLPTVATSLGRITEIIGETGAGLLVPPGDAEAHSLAFYRILSDPALRGKLSDRAKVAAELYSFNSELPKLKGLYQDIITDANRNTTA